jgi:hypothetical protein
VRMRQHSRRSNITTGFVSVKRYGEHGTSGIASLANMSPGARRMPTRSDRTSSWGGQSTCRVRAAIGGTNQASPLRGAPQSNTSTASGQKFWSVCQCGLRRIPLTRAGRTSLRRDRPRGGTPHRCVPSCPTPMWRRFERRALRSEGCVSGNARVVAMRRLLICLPTPQLSVSHLGATSAPVGIRAVVCYFHNLTQLVDANSYHLLHVLDVGRLRVTVRHTARPTLAFSGTWCLSSLWVGTPPQTR